MPRIDVSVFKGEIPALSDRLLPNENSAESFNCSFSSGDLEPLIGVKLFQGADPINLVPQAKSIYLYEDQHWFSWDKHASVVKSPIAQDQYRRIYFEAGAGARVTSNLIATSGSPMPSSSFKLGVPAPSQAPVATVTNPGTGPADDLSDDESRIYVYTYVTAYGEEGAPSPISNTVKVISADGVIALVIPALTSNSNNIDRIRIYRSAVSSGGSVFMLVDEQPLATTSYTDSKLGSQLSQTLTTNEHYPPPDNIKGLTMLANGIMAGFAGNEVLLSVPYQPYAWPFSYRRSLEYDIVAMAATYTGLVIATEGQPYLLSGVSPSSMSEAKIEINQSCVAARSMVDMGSYVIYASPDGLVSVSESGAKVITKNLLSKTDWQALKPETIHAYRYDGKYVAFYTVNGERKGFELDPSNGNLSFISAQADSGFVDIKTDTLYLLNGSALQVWADGDALTYSWTSKIFKTQDDSFSCARVHARGSGNLTLSVHCDGVEVLSLNNVPDVGFRLPVARGDEWQFKLEGTKTVERVTLATNMGDL